MAAASRILTLLAALALAQSLHGFARAAQTAQPAAQESGQSSSRPSPQSADKPVSSGHRRKIRVEESSQPAELTQAEDAIQKKDYATAEPLLHKVVDRDPQNYVAWFDLGFVCNALGRPDDSIAAYRKSVAAKPDIFESNLNLGLMLAKNGQPDAEPFLRAATKLKPTSNVAEGQARAWLSLAHVLEATQPDQALEAYRQAATLQPKDPEPHLAAGLLLEKNNRFADAEQEYKQALALDPNSADALTGLANIYMHAHRFGEAEEYLRKLLTSQSDYAAAHIQLGRVLAADGKNDDAIAELQAGLKLAPNNPSAQHDLADLYARAGKNEQAEAAYRSLLATQPNDSELHRSLGRALMEQKKYPEAEQEFLSAVRLKPDFGDAYGDLAFAANENQHYELTIKALDARAKLLPETPITYFLRATAYDHLRVPKQAAANYHLFLDAAKGRYPDQEWQARHRLIAIEPKK